MILYMGKPEIIVDEWEVQKFKTRMNLISYLRAFPNRLNQSASKLPECHPY